MNLSKNDIDNLEHTFAINLINSITGIKPANLIGTSDLNGSQNLAIFSSIFHLGSKPPLIGFVTRPSKKVIRHTLSNILETKFYTINHIPPQYTKNAHLTSAKFEKEISEFDTCGFTSELKDNFCAPFVKESAIKIGMKYVDSIPIVHNNTTIIIGEVENITIDNNSLIDNNGNIDLSHSSGVSGLHTYYSLLKENSYAHATLKEHAIK